MSDKSFEQQMEETQAYLEHESGRWTRFRDRSERSANLDGQLLLLRNQSMDRLDSLLEQYFAQLVMLEALRNE